MTTSTSTPVLVTPDIEYPDSDGQPMSDNTLQFEWIATLKGGLDGVFRDDLNVFVAGDLLWYPVRGDNKIRTAPDAMVAIGRPKGYRGSYKQWEEANLPPQVVFEVLSPGNRPGELEEKFEFYQRFGVQEYYQYDPDRNIFRGWMRRGETLEAIALGRSWVSPQLGVRFELGGDELQVYGPDGKRFLTYVELVRQRDEEEREREKAEREKEAAEREKEAAEQARGAAEREKEAAEQARGAAEREKEAAQIRAERLAAQLRAMGIEPVE
jgi:Uma2 family endonuclease